MSADNRICIMFCNEAFGTKWAVWHGSGSAYYYQAPDDAEWFATEGEAKDRAFKWFDSIDIVEYGVTWIEKEEQAEGLRSHIASLQWRLSNLEKTGQQIPNFDE